MEILVHASELMYLVQILTEDLHIPSPVLEIKTNISCKSSTKNSILELKSYTSV